jgi:V/A-type H+-transporting ATPase subunit D
MSEITPTRSAILELDEERRAMREGYRFLDEKRLLLASEMLAELRRYEFAARVFRDRLREAAAALRVAVARHGLDGVQVYPPMLFGAGTLQRVSRQLLGIPLLNATCRAESASARSAEHASPEGERSRELFSQLLREAVPLAAHAGNLERLRREYRRTERRARALEQVMMPEMDALIAELESRLEEMEQEEAIRVRRV